MKGWSRLHDNGVHRGVYKKIEKTEKLLLERFHALMNSPRM